MCCPSTGTPVLAPTAPSGRMLQGRGRCWSQSRRPRCRSGAGRGRSLVDPAAATPLVVVSAQGHEWIAEISALQASFGTASLPRVDRWARDLLGVGVTRWINYEFRTGDAAARRGDQGRPAVRPAHRGTGPAGDP